MIRILIIFLLLNFTGYSQNNNLLYKEACFKSNIIKRYNKKNALLDAKKFLNKEQIYLYFNLKDSDSITILLNNEIVSRKSIEVSKDSTGDEPDYSIVINLLKENNFLRIYFEKERCFIEFKVDKRFKVYKLYNYEDCYYITKKNFISI